LTMMHRGGIRTDDGLPAGFPGDLSQSIDCLLTEFMELVINISNERHIRSTVVRSRFPCSLIVILDKNNLFIVAQKHFGTPNTSFIYKPEIEFTSEQILDGAVWEMGFEDPFLITFPAELIEQEKSQRLSMLGSIAMRHVEDEYQRAIKMTSLIQINPLFGPASYSIDRRLAFVIMPFRDDLTEIYDSVIKPTVEDENFSLVCRRADDYKTNKAIIQDIWKGICEARVIIADLTGLNPNVMYELGIAHTVGKDTVLIYQDNADSRVGFPFDLSHIRRIEYKNSAVGGANLRKDLAETLKSILKSEVIS
jgi:hypothetical protein